MIVDYHTHSTWSVDGTMSVEQALAQCQRSGVVEIAFTEHMDLGQPGNRGSAVSIGPYLRELEAMQAAVPDVRIVRGVEAGLCRRNLANSEAYLDQAELDFVIASVHSFWHKDLFGVDVARGRTGAEFLRLYYEEMLFVVEKFSRLCVVGHLDYPLRYFPLSEEDLLSCSDVIDEILQTLVRRGGGLEVNLAGARVIGRPHPPLWVLQRFRELGGRIVTMGSDAHHVSQIARDWHDGVALLREAGFPSITRYRNMKPFDEVALVQ